MVRMGKIKKQMKGQAAAGDLTIQQDSAMPGLCRENPCWDTARSGGDGSRIFEDADILLATDFEGGNGADWRALGPDHYSMRMEPEPGAHLYSGKQYYFCFGAR